MREAKKNCIMGVEDTRNVIISDSFLTISKMFVLAFAELAAVFLAESCIVDGWHITVHTVRTVMCMAEGDWRLSAARSDLLLLWPHRLLVWCHVSLNSVFRLAIPAGPSSVFEEVIGKPYAIGFSSGALALTFPLTLSLLSLMNNDFRRGKWSFCWPRARAT